ncbi:MAG: hypothetical protein ABJA83_15230, partial [Burkholderiaceae bacterium]
MSEKKLAAMGITGWPVRDFFRTAWFTPTLSTALVAALDELPAARGRAAVIAAAPNVQSEVQARFTLTPCGCCGHTASAVAPQFQHAVSDAQCHFVLHHFQSFADVTGVAI